MPAIRAKETKPKRAGVYDGTLACPTCKTILGRKADLDRHMKTHDATAKRYTCSYECCTYSTLQKSNFQTHLRTHSGEKRYVCQDDPECCSFRTADPAAYTRHRKAKHGYVPPPRRAKATAPSKALSARSSVSSLASDSTRSTPSEGSYPSPGLSSRGSSLSSTSSLPDFAETVDPFSLCLPDVVKVENNDDLYTNALVFSDLAAMPETQTWCSPKSEETFWWNTELMCFTKSPFDQLPQYPPVPPVSYEFLDYSNSPLGTVDFGSSFDTLFQFPESQDLFVSPPYLS